MAPTATRRASLAEGPESLQAAWPQLSGAAGDARTSAASEAALADALRLTPLEHFVAWTGEPLDGKPDSLMSHTLACMTEVAEPLSLRELVLRTWRARGERTDNPISVRDVVRQHQSATRVVLVLLERRPGGQFVAVTDIPYGVGSLRRVSRGDAVSPSCLREARVESPARQARGPYRTAWQIRARTAR